MWNVKAILSCGLVWIPISVVAFTGVGCRPRYFAFPALQTSLSDVEVTLNTDNDVKTERTEFDPDVCEQFKVLTCSSTSCAKKRKGLGMDEFATFGAFYGRIRNGKAPDVRIEESPCLGSCKRAPCVAIQHEDFVGNVGLEGMTNLELSERVFHNVITEDDADRVWSCLENAIQLMAEEASDSDQ